MEQRVAGRQRSLTKAFAGVTDDGASLHTRVTVLDCSGTAPRISFGDFANYHPAAAGYQLVI
jgi:hypothetical protein